MNKTNNPYLRLPLEKPLLTIVVSLIIVGFLSLGISWIKIDDDFVKMFPDNIKSKIIWDEIQKDFGSTERLVVAFGRINQSLLDDERSHSKLKDFTDKLEKIDLVDYTTSINSFAIEDDNIPVKFSDYNQKKIDSFMNQDRSYVSIYITPKININNADLVSKVKVLASEELGGYDVHFAGQPYLTGETPGLITKDVRVLMLIGISIMLIVLFINLKSFYAVLIVFLTTLLSLISMIGFMGWMYKMTNYDIFNFTILSTSMPIIILTIANSDGVHIVARFRREVKKNKNIISSVQSTLSHLRVPIFLTSITTAIAFLSMIFSPIPHMIGYGVIIAFGVITAWLLSTTLLPSLILIKKWNLESKTFNQDSFIEKNIKLFSQKVIRNPKKMLIYSSLIVLISFIGVWFVKVEVNVIKFFKEGTSIRQSTDFIDEEMSGSMSFTIRAEGDLDFEDTSDIMLLDSLEKRIKKIQKIPELKSTISYSGIIKESCKEFVGTENEPTLDDLDFCMTVKDPINNDRLSNIKNEEKKSTIISGQIKTVSTERASEISKLIDLEIDKFKKDYDTDVEFETTGLLFFLKEFVSMVVQSALTSILVSILVIFIIIFVFFRRFYWSLLSVIPLLTAIILNFGIMGLIGVELSHLTALLTSVIIGVGVDFSIHYISDYRNKIKSNFPLENRSLQTSQDVGYPIMLDVVSNLGFAALLFSAIIPLNYMGGLMVFAMISTSFGTLTILSSIIELMKARIKA